MAMRSYVLAPILAVLMIGAFACGDGVLDVEPEIDMEVTDDEVSISIDSPGGDVSMQIESGGDVPDGFPFPIAEGCVVVGSTTWEGPEGVAMQAGLEFPPEEFDAVVAFYQAFLEGEGLDVTRSVTETGTDTMVMLLAESQEATASVVANRSGGSGSANLSWSPGQG